MIERTCQQCGKTYQTFFSIKPSFCSSKCAGAAKKTGEMILCIVCKKEFYRLPSAPTRTYCSHSCATTARNKTDQNPCYGRDISGEKNPMHGKGFKGEANPMHGKTKEKAPRWKGGAKKHVCGYVLIIAPDDHPYPAYQKASGTKYILEHRHVMEQHLGRYLKPKEVVHHIDGNKTNNDIGNLQLFACQADHMVIGHSAKLSKIAAELYEEVLSLRAEIARLRSLLDQQVEAG